jgi:hypothetical protein
LLLTEGRPIAVELKHLTAAWTGQVGGERFSLLNQGAQGIRAYDCVKDGERVEQFVASNSGATGLVLALTNDAAYWRSVSHGRATNADAFRLREGSTLTGVRQWGPNRTRDHARARESASAQGQLHLPMARLLFDR